MIRIIVALIIFLTVTSSSFAADENSYKTLPVDTPSFATRVTDDFYPIGLVRVITYSFENQEPLKVRAFYEDFFSKHEWVEWPDGEILQQFNGWSSIAAEVNESNKAILTYGKSWIPKDEKAEQMQELPEAMAMLQLELSAYDRGTFSGKVTLLLTKGIGVLGEHARSLSELLTSDPKNLFILHKELGFDPTDVHKVKLPEDIAAVKDPVLQDYYEIVKKIADKTASTP